MLPWQQSNTPSKSESQEQQHSERGTGRGGVPGCCVTEHGTCSGPWHVDVLVGQKNVRFKMDTGADVTVVSNDAVPKTNFPSESCWKKLFGPGGTPIVVIGQFTADLQFKDTVSTQDVYVVKDLHEPLLGRPAIEALNLVQRVQAVKTESQSASVREMHPKLFSGLGRMSETYTIRLRDDAVPNCVSAPRRVPLPLQKKVEEKLRRLRELDVIRLVNTPTDWCAPIVVVPKARNDAIRLCVDLTKLNERVRQDNYPLPSTDQLLAQLAGATVFSKLDCNSGFYCAAGRRFTGVNEVHNSYWTFLFSATSIRNLIGPRGLPSYDVTVCLFYRA